MNKRDAEYSMKVINRNYVPIDCGFCTFYTMVADQGDDIVLYIHRRFCRLHDRFITYGEGEGRCEVSDFVKILMEGL